MSVELMPNKSEVGEIGVANGTFFTILQIPEVKTLLGEPLLTNDPLNVSGEQAEEMSKILRNWTPPKDWFSRDREEQGKHLFIAFFEECGGFTTR